MTPCTRCGSTSGLCLCDALPADALDQLRAAKPIDRAGLTAAEVEYLFRELPFAVRHRWGGDAVEFAEGVRIAAAR